LSKPTHRVLEQKILSLEKEIEELKAAQHNDETQAEQTRYKQLFDNTSIGILLINAQNKIVDANRQALKLLRYSFDEITAMTEQDLIHPEDINAQPMIRPQDITDGDQSITLERHYLCKNRRYIPVDVHLRSFHDDMLIITFQDISLRKASQKALREANEALEVVYRCANAAIVSMDTKGCVSFWNPAAEKMFGWTQHEVVGKPYPAVLPEMQKDFNDFFSHKLMDGPSFTDLDVLRQRKDGSLFYVSVTNGPTHNENGEVTGLISVMIDITQRKEAELALQQSEERYRSLVENTQDGYFVCDTPNGKFHFLNQTMSDLLLYPPEEAMELTLWDIISPEDHEAMKKTLGLRHDDSPTDSTVHAYQAINKNGTSFRAEISVSRVTFEEKPAIQGLLRDVTEKERLHAKLQQAQRLESVGTLAGGVAHDFNNLLMAIQGNASLALSKTATDHEAYDRLKHIITYTRDASALTKQLLGFARGGKYEVQTTDLNNLVEKTALMFGRTNKEITIRLKPQLDIWPTAVDRGQIEQVLLNLLVNAGQAMPKGGYIIIQTVNTVLDAANAKAYNIKPGKYVKTSVTDTGIGMDKTTQSKIFEPFFTTKDRTRGTGLGLASAYGIIKNHGGIINVSSRPNIGATFSFHLPVTEEKLAIDANNELKTLTGTETILVVDDEQMVLEIAGEMLKGLGYNIHKALGGRNAIEIYRQKRIEIDMVILDMIMPEMGGKDTYCQLKEIDPEVSVLLSSGYSLDKNTSKILALGCKGFIQKPFTVEELSIKIRDILNDVQ
jgi:two-component system, cell cycle sensor histidine kinase and response regulator CckA